jgi:hypothetical protein
MSVNYIICPECDKEYDVNWGDEGKEFDCTCGIKLEIKYDESYDEENNDEYGWWWAEKINDNNSI